MRSIVVSIALLSSISEAIPAPWKGWGYHHQHGKEFQVQLGPRPYYLVQKTRLSCV
jgi:hypothetical protein